MPKKNQETKTYTPKGAIRAMLAGSILKNKDGLYCFWDDDLSCFMAKFPNVQNSGFLLENFEGLQGYGHQHT